MNKAKKLFLTFLSLILIFTLIACSKDNEEDLNLEKDLGMKEIEENMADENPEENIRDEVYVDSLEERIKSSNFIARVELSDLGGGNDELKIIENIKGNLSQANLAQIEGMEKNIEYLIFLRDVEGLVDLTDNESLISLENNGQDKVNEVKEILIEN